MRFLHALAVSVLVSSARANVVDCTEEPDKCKHADSCDTCGVHPGSEVSVENLEYIFFLFLLFPSSKTQSSILKSSARRNGHLDKKCTGNGGSDYWCRAVCISREVRLAY